MERLKTTAIVALLFALAGSIALAATGGTAEVRITVRQIDDGRVEFALQQRTDGEWGERILPRSRYFPTNATVGRWLNSTPMTVTTTVAEEDALDAEEGEAPTTTTTPEATDSNAFTAISAGGKHTCAIRSTDGAIECWGSNKTTKASVETATGRVQVYSGQASPPEGNFRAVSAGSDHTCAIRENKTIRCWGTNDYGQSRAPAGSFTAVSAGWDHTCAIRESGEIACWGRNHLGQTDAPGGSFTAVSAVLSHTCGLRTSGAIECWGWDEERTDAPGGSFIAVSASFFSNCGLRADGTIECWGWNEEQSNAPDGSYTSVSTGSAHTCGLRESGEITCWGANDYGQASPPTGSFIAISAGSSHTCGLRADGAIECWGWNDEGQTDVPTNRAP